MPPTSRDTQFGSFRLSPRERRLQQNGQDIPLTPKAFDTLVVLVTHAGQLVEKQDLMKAVWGEVFVDDSTLTQNIFTLRKALGDREFIETVPRKGYRFTAPVTPLELSPESELAGGASAKKEIRLDRRHALGALGLGVAAAWVYAGRLPYNPLEGATDWVEITKTEADDLDAVISPDGKFVAYLAESNGIHDIMMYEVAAKEPYRWSSDGWAGTVPNLVRDLGFTPSGWVWNRPPKAGQASSTSGQLQRRSRRDADAQSFLEFDATQPVWSPDGKRVVYIRDQENDTMYMADGETFGERTKIFGDGEEGMHNHPMDWYGDWVYFTRGHLGALNQFELWRIRPSDKYAEQLTDFHTDIGYPCAIDDRTVLYLARDEKGAGPWLWALDAKTRIPRRIPSGTNQFIGLAASKEKPRRVVATIAKPTAKLWSVPIFPSGRIAQDRDIQAWDLGADRALSPSFIKDSGGEALLFLSSNGGADGLLSHRQGDEKPTERWDGNDGALFYPPAVSRDGTTIVINVRENSRWVLTILGNDGPRQIGETLDIVGNATWNPECTELLAGGKDREEVRGLFLIPKNGSAPRCFLKGELSNPVWSAEADLIVYSQQARKGRANLRAVRRNGEPVKLPAEAQVSATGVQSGVFLPGGKSLIYRLGQNFYRIDFGEEKSIQITDLSLATTIGGFDITPDGKQILFAKLRRNSDIYYIDLPDPPWWRWF